MYKCSKCNIEKDASDFHKKPGKGNRKVSFYCKVCQSEYIKQYRKANFEKVAKVKYLHTLRVKFEGIEAYGGKCVCCGESEQKFLTIDHINERDEGDVWTGKRLWAKLKSLGYPKDNYQLLCFNCNWAKYYYGVCPHQTKYKTDFGAESPA
jgi:hypothetical protein